MQGQYLTSKRILTGVALLLLLLLLQRFVMPSMPDSVSVASRVDSAGAAVTEPEAIRQAPAMIDVVEVYRYPATPPTANSKIDTIVMVDEMGDYDSVNTRISMIQGLPLTDDAPYPVAQTGVIDQSAEAILLVEQVRGWARAWSDKNIADYIGFYAPRYRAGFDTHEQWIAHRRSHILRAGKISVAVSHIEVSWPVENRPVIEFRQAYESPWYSDRVIKRLSFGRVGSQWKITKEHSTPIKLLAKSKPEPKPAPVIEATVTVAESKPARIVQSKPKPAPVAEPVVTAAESKPARRVQLKPATSSPAIAKPRTPVAETRPAEIIPVALASRPVARYQRLDNSGATATGDDPWSCVKDNHSELVWEVKTRDGGPRDADNLYTWFDPTLRGQSGIEDGGRCSGNIDCDTHSYRVEMNARNLCGYSDWRLPTREELQTLVVFKSDRAEATIDENYFPAAAASWYWTASTNERRPEYAWYVLFRNGIPLNDLKARPKHIRLVRGNPLTLASNP